jgi:hypothetical protein
MSAGRRPAPGLLTVPDFLDFSPEMVIFFYDSPLQAMKK